MSNVVASSIAKPSQAVNMVYVIFGYALTFSYFHQSNFEVVADYLLFVAIVGGFIGTFLFFIRPLERILRLYFCVNKRYLLPGLKRSWVFYSPYLAEMRAKIIGGLYFGLTCLIVAYYNVNLNLVSGDYLCLVKNFLLIAAIIVFLITFFELYLFIKRSDGVTICYAAQFGLIKETVNVRLLRDALTRKDWGEVELIIEKSSMRKTITDISTRAKLAERH